MTPTLIKNVPEAPCGASSADEEYISCHSRAENGLFMSTPWRSRQRGRLGAWMRQTHHAGEKLFIDYSGKKIELHDRETGEAKPAELYVAVLGASNYTYAEATWTQRLGDFVMSTIRALEYFGAVPQLLVPDQLRSTVSSPDRYDPDINPTYAEMATHSL